MIIIILIQLSCALTWCVYMTEALRGKAPLYSTLTCRNNKRPAYRQVTPVWHQLGFTAVLHGILFIIILVLFSLRSPETLHDEEMFSSLSMSSCYGKIT